MYWDTWNEAEKFLFFSGAYTDEPFRRLTWRQEGPTQKGHAIVKSKHSVVIFHIVCCEQLVHFLSLCIVSKINIGPKISCWKRVRLFVYLIYRFYFYWLVPKFLIYLLVGLGDRLVAPKIVGVKEGWHVDKLYGFIVFSLLAKLICDFFGFLAELLVF